MVLIPGLHSLNFVAVAKWDFLADVMLVDVWDQDCGFEPSFTHYRSVLRNTLIVLGHNRLGRGIRCCHLVSDKSRAAG